MAKLTESEKIKGSIFFLYLGKLRELNLIGGGGFSLTTEGFDLAIDAYEKGERLTQPEIKGYLEAIPGLENNIEMQMNLFLLIDRLQEKGFDFIKSEVEELKEILEENEGKN